MEFGGGRLPNNGTFVAKLRLWNVSVVRKAYTSADLSDVASVQRGFLMTGSAKSEPVLGVPFSRSPYRPAPGV